MIDNEKKNIMKSFRARAGYSQEQVAKKLGITRQTFVIYEKNPGIMTIETFGKLKDLYGDDFETVFFEKKLYK